MDERGYTPNRLGEVRREKGVTQVQLAAAAGLRQTFISDLETGRSRNPSWRAVKRIADALGVSPDDIFPVPAKGEAAL